MESDPPLSFNQIISGVTEFIEVAIHTILYVRQVYPAEIFVRRKKYNTPVFQARHPALIEYISGVVKAVADELIQGNVDKVIVVIKDKEDVALERFIFALQTMIQVEAFNKETGVEGAMTAPVLGQYFRSFLVKLSMIESQLGPLGLGEDISFAVVIELKDNKTPSVTHGKDPPPWVPATLEHTTTGSSEQAELHMLKAVDTGIINLSLAVQESERKLSMEKVLVGEGGDDKGKERAV